MTVLEQLEPWTMQLQEELLVPQLVYVRNVIREVLQSVWQLAGSRVVLNNDRLQGKYRSRG